MLTVHYFGEIAEKTGKTEEKIEMRHKQISELLRELQEKYELQPGEFQLAVNHNLVDASEEFEVKESDEIALLSAFAGG